MTSTHKGGVPSALRYGEARGALESGGLEWGLWPGLGNVPPFSSENLGQSSTYLQVRIEGNDRCAWHKGAQSKVVTVQHYCLHDCVPVTAQSPSSGTSLLCMCTLFF